MLSCTHYRTYQREVTWGTALSPMKRYIAAQSLWKSPTAEDQEGSVLLYCVRLTRPLTSYHTTMVCTGDHCRVAPSPATLVVTRRGPRLLGDRGGKETCHSIPVGAFEFRAMGLYYLLRIKLQVTKVTQLFP